MLDVSQHSGAEVLAALYNASFQQGLGIRDPRGQQTITVEQAQFFIDEAVEAGFKGEGGTVYFDYLLGRILKVEIGYDTINERQYDTDNGDGAAIKALDGINPDIKTIRLDVD